MDASATKFAATKVTERWQVSRRKVAGKSKILWRILDFTLTKVQVYLA